MTNFSRVRYPGLINPNWIRKSFVSGCFACLLLFGTAFHFLIVAPATQILARVQLDLATRHIQSEAERTFRRMETQLRTARSWGQAERLKFDDTAGFNALLVPLLAGDAQISAIHLADTDGREVMLMRDTDGWRNRVTQPGTQDKGNRWLHWSTAGTLLDDNWKNGHYDPRSRPWFEAALKTASDDTLAWTAPYRLLTTAAKWWKKLKSPDDCKREWSLVAQGRPKECIECIRAGWPERLLAALARSPWKVLFELAKQERGTDLKTFWRYETEGGHASSEGFRCYPCP